jgi:ring-1,2-phenylacetyl-CoA epoxidase subunit PaaC
VVRLGDGTQESHNRMVNALEICTPCVPELFEVDEVYRSLEAQDLVPAMNDLQAQWERQVHAVLSEATLSMPEITNPMSGGRVGLHSEHLGYLLAEMQFLQRAYPGATW